MLARIFVWAVRGTATASRERNATRSRIPVSRVAVNQSRAPRIGFAVRVAASISNPMPPIVLLVVPPARKPMPMCSASTVRVASRAAWKVTPIATVRSATVVRLTCCRMRPTARRAAMPALQRSCAEMVSVPRRVARRLTSTATMLSRTVAKPTPNATCSIAEAAEINAVPSMEPPLA